MVAFDCVFCAASFLSDGKMLEILEKIEENNEVELTKAENAKVKEYLENIKNCERSFLTTVSEEDVENFKSKVR